MATPMVSVLCTVYNHGLYVRDALEGFVSQKTNFPFEVLVHDDASTDDSADIIREYEEKYPDIIKPIYQTENQYSRGGRITERFQVPRITGKYVAFCEGDDYWVDPLKLQKQVDFLEQNPEYTMCAGSTIWLDMKTGTKKKKCQIEADRDISLEEIVLEKKGRVFQVSSVLVRADMYCNKPLWAKSFGVGDLPLAILAATVGKVYMFSDVVSVYRNQVPNSVTDKLKKNPEYVARVYNRVIDGLNMYNEATDYKHKDIVDRRIKIMKYNTARANRDLKTMRTGELREVYLSRSYKARVMDILACKAPALQKAILKWLR